MDKWEATASDALLVVKHLFEKEIFLFWVLDRFLIEDLFFIL